MRRLLQPFLQATRFCARCLLTFACWTLWLVLAVILAFQIHILTSSELAVPPPLLREIEARLKASGVRATFGRTSVDPSGRLLVENIVSYLPAYSDPIMTARALYVRFDPWALLLGRFEELEFRVTGVRLLVPAVLSPSGRSEELVRNLDAAFTPTKNLLELSHLTFEVANLRVSASGSVPLPPAPATDVRPLPVPEFLARNYPALARNLTGLAGRLTPLDHPALTVALAPSASGMLIGDFTLNARGLAWPEPALTAGPLQITARFPLRADRILRPLVRINAEAVIVPSVPLTARGFGADLRVEFNPADGRFALLSVEATADFLTAAGIRLESPVVRLAPQPLPRVAVELVTTLAGLPLALSGTADLSAQTASIDFAAGFGDAHLDLISARIGRDVRSWIDFPRPVAITAAHADFAAGWRWSRVTARLTIPIINAYRVPLTDGRVALDLTPDRWSAPEAFARIGENYARGSYEHDPATHRYRFLLAGRLRPVEIAGWFSGNWWTEFFTPFVFVDAPPPASVEVAGRWGRNTGGESRVIVAAAVTDADIRTARFDYARARLFIRPHYIEALELYGTQGPGSLRGTFARSLDPRTREWLRFDFNAVADAINLSLAEKIFGQAATEILSPFAFSAPPKLRLSGRLDSANAPGGARQSIDLAGETETEFRFKDFPVDRLAFEAKLRDDDLTVDRLDLGFAGGTATGRARVSGIGPARRVGFDCALKDASLGRAIAVLENFTAKNRGSPPPSANRFLAEQSTVRLNLAASAEGPYDDPYGYHGEGNATLEGSSLGEVRMLGLLSELFRFTSLRFTAARTNFKIDGHRLLFTDVGVTGANSAITASGSYALDRRILDFKAKVFPFQESNLLLKNLVGAVLTPFSNAFEVKLTGPLDQPAWSFVMGPTNFLRNLAPAPGPAQLFPLPSPPQK